MYKSGNAKEKFTEVFAYHLAKELKIPTAVYEVDGDYVRSKDFTNGAKSILKRPMVSLGKKWSILPSIEN